MNETFLLKTRKVHPPIKQFHNYVEVTSNNQIMLSKRSNTKQSFCFWEECKYAKVAATTTMNLVIALGNVPIPNNKTTRYAIDLQLMYFKKMSRRIETLK